MYLIPMCVLVLLWTKHGECVSMQLKLSAGPNNLLGRLEVSHGIRRIWGTVCDDNFDDRAASVACRQMGHRAGRFFAGHPSIHVPKGKGIILMDDLDCKGGETSLAQCMTKQWGDHNCIHHEDVFLQCYPHLLLAQGTGQLEVKYDDIWGGICAHQFGSLEATVACLEMEYQAGVVMGTYINSGSMWLDNVLCDGSEISIVECATSAWGENKCENSEGVILQCLNDTDTFQKIRLFGGQDAFSGVLELQYAGIWGTVCFKEFDDLSANVTCREMGYTSGQYLRFVGNVTEHLPWHDHTIWFDDIRCKGNESSLNDCNTSPLGATSCEHWQDVVMRCFDGRQSTTIYDLNLFDGINTVSGRLEMIYAGVQFVFCKSTFDNNEINVACREMGKLSGGLIEEKRYINASNFENITLHNMLWKTNIHCLGNESKLVDCFSNDWLQIECDMPDDVLAVYCTDNEPINSPLLDVIQYPVPYDIAITYQYHLVSIINETWGIYESIAFNKMYVTDNAVFAKLACRDLGYDLGQIVEHPGIHFYRPYHLFTCYGYEYKLRDCVLEVKDCCYDGTFYLGCYREFTFSLQERVLNINLISNQSTIVGRLIVCKVGYKTFTYPNNSTETKIIARNLIPCLEGFPTSLVGSICKTMGFNYGRFFSSNRHSFQYNGWVSRSIYLAGLKCNDQESSLQQCLGQINEDSECPNVGIKTINDVILKCFKTGELDFQIKPAHNSGSLKVFYEGSWETVCFIGNNSHYAADLACKYLGYSAGNLVMSQNSGPEQHCGIDGHHDRSWYYGVECMGHEEHFFDCRSLPDHSCSNCHDAILQCRADVRVIGQESSWPWVYSGFLEIEIQGTWQRVCAESFDNNLERVACRQLGFSRGKQSSNFKWETLQRQFTNLSMFFDISCIGNESSLSECEIILWKEHHCEPEDCVFLQCWNDNNPESGYQIRLADGRNASSGRLEVYHEGQWGTVCKILDQDGTIPDVVCRELGFETGLYLEETSFGVGPLWQNNLLCMGDEFSLLECDRIDHNDPNCDHTRDIHIRCLSDLFNIRLYGGQTKNVGRLEVKYRNKWGTVCSACDFIDYYWEETYYSNYYFYFSFLWRYIDPEKICNLRLVARVACREMGYWSGKVINASEFDIPQATTDTPVWITYIDCEGDETQLEECTMEVNKDKGDYSDEFYYSQNIYDLFPLDYYILQYHGYNEYNFLPCRHNLNDLYLECYLTMLRIAGGPHPNVGRLEISFEGQWGTICDDLFLETTHGVNVACRELGYSHGQVLSEIESRQMVNENAFDDSAMIWLDDVQCNGTEAKLTACLHTEWGEHNCNHNEDVFVQCFNESSDGDHYTSSTSDWHSTSLSTEKQTVKGSHSDTSTMTMNMPESTEKSSQNKGVTVTPVAITFFLNFIFII